MSVGRRVVIKRARRLFLIRFSEEKYPTSWVLSDSRTAGKSTRALSVAISPDRSATVKRQKET